jgi:hypothetical protein
MYYSSKQKTTIHTPVYKFTQIGWLLTSDHSPYNSRDSLRRTAELPLLPQMNFSGCNECLHRNRHHFRHLLWPGWCLWFAVNWTGVRSRSWRGHVRATCLFCWTGEAICDRSSGDREPKTQYQISLIEHVTSLLWGCRHGVRCALKEKLSTSCTHGQSHISLHPVV